ncbi:AAA family ATPase [Chryseobacterium sp. G0240]|uniref:AAA family ATPase n=1 Tax=Chryseobacterium sp. G0240 TaxID=2487066 RepID=UPI001E2AC06C|nr:AAA family ATPase [Chryseobacterium sp. G0240]
MMITFFVGTSTHIRNRRKYELPHVILSHNSWNDWWEYQTLYYAELIDNDGNSHDLGGIKIGKFNLQNGAPPLPNIFNELPADFFSLGQDVSYYEEIQERGDDFREEILEALNDISYNEDLYNEALNEKVTYRSLLRSVSTRSVIGQFNRLANGNATLTNYDFTYKSFSNRRGIPALNMNFRVDPQSYPPSNIHVIIGRNGVGKTHLINNMIESLLDDNALKFGKFTSPISDLSSEIFANLVSVTFSAFDETEPKPERRDKRAGISYSYIGLREERRDVRFAKENLNDENKPQKKYYTTKSPTKLKNEFVKSAIACKISGKLKRLKSAVHALETDSIFNDSDLNSIFDIKNTDDFEEKAGIVFKKFSSGHKIVLITITRLVETLQERSLVLLDEPEAHLHPPLLSAFIRALSDLLVKQNAVAIIATHSPVVLQEVPKSCCWKLNRIGSFANAERLEIESFGENVGSLTQEVFGLEVTDAGFHKILKDSVNELETYEDIAERFNNQLGFEAKAILRGMILNNNR